MKGFSGHIHIDLLNIVYHANSRTSQERFQPQIAKKERPASAPTVDVLIKKEKKKSVWEYQNYCKMNFEQWRMRWETERNENNK